ncbi:MAG: helix-turn-helix domain-containing protein [Betaproteobacteria bacterium]|nr:helix-turn-helix domain-containing protein [Betaproteobacteria bacterium]
MADTEKILFGMVTSAGDVGRLVSRRRKAQGLTQADLAGLGQTGNRFIGELERGKGTVQFDKVLHVLKLLGLDVVVVERGS